MCAAREAATLHEATEAAYQAHHPTHSLKAEVEGSMALQLKPTSSKSRKKSKERPPSNIRGPEMEALTDERALEENSKKFKVEVHLRLIRTHQAQGAAQLEHPVLGASRLPISRRMLSGNSRT